MMELDALMREDCNEFDEKGKKFDNIGWYGTNYMNYVINNEK